MRLLIVDDEYEKAIEISRLVNSLNLGVVIEHATTATGARRLLQIDHFDFVIVDLNLPDAMGAAPTQDGGLQFFDMLAMDEGASLPTDVLFISALEELVTEARAKVVERGGFLCRFSSDSDEWKRVLTGKLKLAAERVRRAKLARPKIDVAIVTALLTPELDAVLDLKYGWLQKRFPGDPTLYHFGTIQREGSEVSVVAASALRKGMPSSAALASKIVERFRPQYIVMLGICAGVRGKTNLGDVIVADPSWDCGSGKMSESKDGSSVFLAAPYPKPLNTQVSQLAMEHANKSATAKEIRASWLLDAPPCQLAIRVGPMASGAAVLASSDAVLPISAQNRELLAVEMEAYAVMAAADYASGPAPVSLAIKSVCDFADSAKSDAWQAYASFTSAAFFDRFFKDPALPMKSS